MNSVEFYGFTVELANWVIPSNYFEFELEFILRVHDSSIPDDFPQAMAVIDYMHEVITETSLPDVDVLAAQTKYMIYSLFGIDLENLKYSIIFNYDEHWFSFKGYSYVQEVLLKPTKSKIQEFVSFYAKNFAEKRLNPKQRLKILDHIIPLLQETVYYEIQDVVMDSYPEYLTEELPAFTSVLNYAMHGGNPLPDDRLIYIPFG